MLLEPFSLVPPQALQRQSLLAGAVLFRQSDPATGMYLLEAGEVHLLRYGQEGSEIIIHRAFSGESFAEASLFSELYHCDAVARAPSVVVRMDKLAALELLQNSADFAVSLAAHLAGQVQSYRSLNELRAIKSAETRVLAAITEGRLKGNIKAFASQIGLSHEATYRALASLVKNQRLQKSAHGSYRLL